MEKEPLRDMGFRKKTEEGQETEASRDPGAGPDTDTGAEGDPGEIRERSEPAEAAEATADDEYSDVGAEGRAPEEVVETLSAGLAEMEDRYLRLVAEFDNFRKRTVRERAQYGERAQANLVKELLESLDDLARVSHMSSAEHDASSILEGLRLVEQKLLRALERAGLQPIEAVGERFDPEIHEALLTVETSDPEEDEVVSQEMARGYLFGDLLLRPSLVEVKKYSEQVADEGTGSDTNGDS